MMIKKSLTTGVVSLMTNQRFAIKRFYSNKNDDYIFKFIKK